MHIEYRTALYKTNVYVYIYIYTSLSALLCIYVSFGSLLKQTKQIPIFEGILQQYFQ